MTFEIYKDTSKEYRWRIKARNGKIMADSGEGYKRKGSAIKSISVITGEIVTEIEKHGVNLVKDLTV